ncbi:hypothetical protein N0V86_004363 [Didymella sp. IMI 355093]|nr:hypothetical protein N0V86_004363 [Didymella sp. IMI 355093]
MGKPGLGLFTGRRKSQSNVLDDMAANAAPASPDAAAAAPVPPAGESGGFRLMSRQEVTATAERRKTMEKEKKSSFPRFTGFGSGSNKARNQSFEDESPGSSKRDSKSSSGTQFSTSRPYINGQHGSTSTLPSSTDTGSDDNLFANVPRPQIAQHSSSPGSYFSSKKTLPALPKSSSGAPSNNNNTMPFGFGKRDRAMTTSSYASTAIPPKLDQDMSFGESSFDDIFSGLQRQPSPEMQRHPEPTGRSLLAEKRTFQPEPIKVLPQQHIEAPLRSWDSRGSADNLMDSPRSENDSPPAPPPHKYQQYAPVSMAPDSPDLQSSATFLDRNGHAAREPFMQRGVDSSPEQHPTSISTSSAHSFETPLSSRSASTSATPRAPLPPSAIAYDDNDEDNMFAPPPSKPQAKTAPAPRPAPPAVKNPPRPVAAGGSRVMSQAEFREYQKKQAAAPPPEESDSEEDYEDEEDAIKKREEEEILRRKTQQMSFAREAMRRSTTAPSDPNRPESIVDNAFNPSMGFPSETSMKADEWEDEDVPLGILQQHGFPSTTRNRVPNQPANAIPSYFPDRPASAGAMGGNRASNLPAFARRLPMDPHDSFIGGGLVHHANRESLGFNNFPRGPQSVAGDAMSAGYGQSPMGPPPPLMYQDAGMAAPSLVDQIQMRDMTKKKYLGGASQKKPVEGPFTGMLGQQMNAQGQPQNPMRMSQMPMMNGMNGMNGMNPMMMGGGMNSPMMGMGMGQMGYNPQQQEMFQMQMQYQQMQQMFAMQQMQMQMQQQQQQDPRMSMAMPNNMFNNSMMGQGQNMMGNNSFLSVPGMQNGMQPPQNRPMSIMSSSQRPFSTFGGGMGMGPGPGYTPSIAPSERSNIGLSARYRPVTNHSDAVSNGTSMTLQATSGGANKPGVIKGILKKSPQISVEERDDEEDWGSMAARKSKFGKGKENASNGLEDLTRGLNI